MDGQYSLFALSDLCEGCPVRAACGAERTRHACRDTQGAEDPGGEHVLHPLSESLNEWLTVLGGVGFEAIRAQPTALPSLPPYLPQVENREALSGYLGGAVYAIRLHDAMRRGRVLPAAEVRGRLGLRDDQALTLLPFDRDELLEQIWTPQILAEIAAGDYTLVVSPSYSIWTPRPRTEFLINTRRSMHYFEALQHAGARAVPRVAWNVERDVERYADWVAANPSIGLVALDLQTYRGSPDWDHQLKGLARFDRSTGERLRYLVNGPTVVERYAALFRVVSPERLHLTNATSQVGVRVPGRGRSLLVGIRSPGRRFLAQSRIQAAMVHSATEDYVRTARAA